jgi:isopentenyldiphosphate isomerase
MEMVDVLNNDGTPTGQRVSKKEVHEKGWWHRTVHVWIVNNRKEILMQITSKNVTHYPGEYDISTAGHLSAGESPTQGALRELKEELGIKLSKEDLIEIGEIKQEGYRTVKTKNKEWCNIFLIRKDIPADELTLDSTTIESVKYISICEFKKWINNEDGNPPIHPDELKILFKYLEKF